MGLYPNPPDNAALGLGALALGGFHDDVFVSLLGADREHEVALLAVAVGWPASDRSARRALIP